MTYGTIKVDTVTFTDAGVDKSVTLSGLVQNPTFSGNVTVTGTLSGVTVTGTTANFTSGNFTNISGGTHTITSGVFAAGSAASPSITFTGDLNTGIYSPGADQVAISTNGSGRLFVDSAGRVLVGTSNTAGTQLVKVNGSTSGSIFGGTISLTQGRTAPPNGSTHGVINFGSETRPDGGASIASIADGAWTDGSSYPSTLILSTTASSATSPIERLRITSAGLVGVGTSSPSEALTVAGNIRVNNSNPTLGLYGANGTSPQVIFGNSAGTAHYSIYETTDPSTGTRGSLNIYDVVAAANRVTVDTSGRLGVGTTSPTTNLHVVGGGPGVDAEARISSNQNAALLSFAPAGTNAIRHYTIGSAVGGSLIFYDNTASSQRAAIDSSGRLLVGTSSSASGGNLSPYARLQVVGNTAGGADKRAVLNLSADYVYTGLSTNDPIGTISFNDNSGREFAWITGAVDGTVGNNDYPGRLVFSTTADGASSPTERLRIDSSGRVGIGTSSPSAPLNVRYDNTGTTTVALFENQRSVGGSPDAAQIVVGARGYNHTIIRQNSDQGTNAIGGTLDTVIANTYGSPGAKLILATQSTARLTVDASGNVGIGTTTPSAKLEVSGGNIRFDNNQGVEWGGANNYIYGNESTDFIAIATNGNERARIDSSGRLLVGTSSARSFSGFAATRFQVEGTTYGDASLSLTNNENTADGAYVLLGKSRGTTLGSATIVNNNDALAAIRFAGADGSFLRGAADIAAYVDGTPGANDMPGRLVFSVTQDGSASPTERMRIDSNGVTHTFSSGSSNFIPRSAAAANTSNYFIQGCYGATNTQNGTISFQVFTNGNVQNTNNSYAGISDIKLKENIVNATSQWSDIKALQVRKYNFKEGQTHTQIGLVAQEVELVSPGLVTESPDRDDEGNDLGTVTKSVNYSVLYMKAVKALQEAMERIETLEAKVAALESA